MDQALTNKRFIEQIDDVIETLGGTPVDLELTEDREDDMVSNGVFADKMDEVIEALGGTPSEIVIDDDKADDMVSDNIFQLKMEDVVKNMSGGGGSGGSSIIHPVNVTMVNSRNDSLSFISSAVPDLVESSGYSGFYVGTGNVMSLINQESEWLPTLQSGTTILPTAYILEDTAIYLIDFMGEGYTYSIVGDATEGEIEGMKYVAITGDCTITIS